MGVSTLCSAPLDESFPYPVMLICFAPNKRTSLTLV
jgi:hypothetical protein